MIVYSFIYICTNDAVHRYCKLPVVYPSYSLLAQCTDRDLSRISDSYITHLPSYQITFNQWTKLHVHMLTISPIHGYTDLPNCPCLDVHVYQITIALPTCLHVHHRTDLVLYRFAIGLCNQCTCLHIRGTTPFRTRGTIAFRNRSSTPTPFYIRGMPPRGNFRIGGTTPFRMRGTPLEGGWGGAGGIGCASTGASWPTNKFANSLFRPQTDLPIYIFTYLHIHIFTYLHVYTFIKHKIYRSTNILYNYWDNQDFCRLVYCQSTNSQCIHLLMCQFTFFRISDTVF